jgi:hypothetical protein
MGTFASWMVLGLPMLSVGQGRELKLHKRMDGTMLTPLKSALEAKYTGRFSSRR